MRNVTRQRTSVQDRTHVHQVQSIPRIALDRAHAGNARATCPYLGQIQTDHPARRRPSLAAALLPPSFPQAHVVSPKGQEGTGSADRKQPAAFTFTRPDEHHDETAGDQETRAPSDEGSLRPFAASTARAPVLGSKALTDALAKAISHSLVLRLLAAVGFHYEVVSL